MSGVLPASHGGGAYLPRPVGLPAYASAVALLASLYGRYKRPSHSVAMEEGLETKRENNVHDPLHILDQFYRSHCTYILHKVGRVCANKQYNYIHYIRMQPPEWIS